LKTGLDVGPSNLLGEALADFKLDPDDDDDDLLDGLVTAVDELEDLIGAA